MKSSFAQTFLDVSRGEKSRDRIFAERATRRSIQDEGGKELGPENIFVVRPYDEEFGPTEKTFSLLVDSQLRKEYEKIHSGIERAKDVLIKALKNQSGSKRDFEREISSAFTRTETEFTTALGRIRKELADQKDMPFANVAYEKIFDDKILSFLTSNTQAQAAIFGYVTRYTELLTKFTYLGAVRSTTIMPAR